MKELRDIVEAARRRAGEPLALATIVATRGSTYRRPGAHMLIAADGSTVGAVSGGCLEREVIEKGLEVLETGRSAVVEYDTTEPDDVIFGSGLGCRGIVRLLLEPLSPPWLEFAAATLERHVPGVAALALAGSEGPLPRLFVRLEGSADGSTADPGLIEAARARLAKGRSGLETLPGPGGEVFFEVLRPAPRLFVFGAGYDSVPLVRLGRELGLPVTVVDHRPAFAVPERFPEADAVLLLRPDEVAAALPLSPWSAAVLMTHSYSQDLGLLEALLPSPVPYLGLLGPKDRSLDILAAIERNGAAIGAAERARIKSPVGLDLGAETPEQIALAILAEVQAVFAGHSGGALSRREGPIHQPHATIGA